MEDKPQNFLEDLSKIISLKELHNLDNPIIIHSEKGVYFNGVLYEGENAEQLAIKARNQYYNK